MQVGAPMLGVQLIRVEGIVDQWISGFLGVPSDSRPFVDPGWAYQVDTTRLDEHSTHADQLLPLDYKLIVRPAYLGWSSFEFHPCVKEWELLAVWAFRCPWVEAKLLLEQATKDRWRPEDMMEGQGIIQLASDMNIYLEHGPDSPTKEMVSVMTGMALQWAAVAALAGLEGDIRREAATQQEGASAAKDTRKKKATGKKKAADSKAKNTGKANDPGPMQPLSSPPPCPSHIFSSPPAKAGPAATTPIALTEHKGSGLVAKSGSGWLPSSGSTHARLKVDRHSHASKQTRNTAGCS